MKNIPIARCPKCTSCGVAFSVIWKMQTRQNLCTRERTLSLTLDASIQRTATTQSWVAVKSATHHTMTTIMERHRC